MIKSPNHGQTCYIKSPGFARHPQQLNIDRCINLSGTLSCRALKLICWERVRSSTVQPLFVTPQVSPCQGTLGACSHRKFLKLEAAKTCLCRNVIFKSSCLDPRIFFQLNQQRLYLNICGLPHDRSQSPTRNWNPPLCVESPHIYQSAVSIHACQHRVCAIVIKPTDQRNTGLAQK